MIQTIRKKLKVPEIWRTKIAVLAGVSPGIIALLFMFTTRTSAISHDSGWITYLVQHQGDIVQTLIVSSVMVAVFSTLLRYKLATFAAGFQPVLIQLMFILTDSGRHIALNLPLAAITVLPLLILLIALIREIGEEETKKG